MDRRRHLVWAAAGVSLVLAVGSLAGEGGFRRYARLRRDVQSLEDRNLRLRGDNARLRQEIARLRTEPLAVERAAREQLGLVKAGEVVFNLEEP